MPQRQRVQHAYLFLLFPSFYIIDFRNICLFSLLMQRFCRVMPTFVTDACATQIFFFFRRQRFSTPPRRGRCACAMLRAAINIMRVDDTIGKCIEAARSSSRLRLLPALYGVLFTVFEHRARQAPPAQRRLARFLRPRCYLLGEDRGLKARASSARCGKGARRQARKCDGSGMRQMF